MPGQPGPGAVLQPDRRRWGGVHRRRHRLVLQAERGHGRRRSQGVHRLPAETDLRGAGLRLHRHGGGGSERWPGHCLRRCAGWLPVRDAGERPVADVAVGDRHPVHHGQRLLRVVVPDGGQRQDLHWQRVPLRQPADPRRPGRLRPGHREEFARFFTVPSGSSAAGSGPARRWTALALCTCPPAPSPRTPSSATTRCRSSSWIRTRCSRWPGSPSPTRSCTAMATSAPHP